MSDTQIIAGLEIEINRLRGLNTQLSQQLAIAKAEWEIHHTETIQRKDEEIRMLREAWQAEKLMTRRRTTGAAR